MQRNTNDAKDILLHFVSKLTAESGGRELEVSSIQNAVVEGKTNVIEVYRSDALASGSKELLELLNEDEFDIRWPLKVDFVGEGRQIH